MKCPQSRTTGLKIHKLTFHMTWTVDSKWFETHRSKRKSTQLKNDKCSFNFICSKLFQRKMVMGGQSLRFEWHSPIEKKAMNEWTNVWGWDSAVAVLKNWFHLLDNFRRKRKVDEGRRPGRVANWKDTSFPSCGGKFPRCWKIASAIFSFCVNALPFIPFSKTPSYWLSRNPFAFRSTNRSFSPWNKWKGKIFRVLSRFHMRSHTHPNFNGYVGPGNFAFSTEEKKRQKPPIDKWRLHDKKSRGKA